MKKIFSEKNKCLLIGITFVTVLLIKLLLVINACPARSLRDESGALATGAFFAGYDWSNVMQYNDYYGGGATIWLAPLIRIFHAHPVILYKVIIAVYCICESLIAIITFKILVRFFKIKNLFFVFLCSIALNFLTFAPTVTVMNEAPYRLGTWLIILTLFYLVDSETLRKKFTILLFVEIAWICTLHTRGTVFIYAVILVTVIYYILERKQLFNFKLGILFIPIYLLANLFNTFVQQNVWMAGEGEVLNNTSVVFQMGISSLFKYENLRAILAIVTSQLMTINLYSFGLFSFCIIGAIGFMWEYVKSKRKSSGIDYDKESYKYLPILLVIIAVLCATEIAFLSNWGYNLGMLFADETGDVYFTKALTYLRYHSPYIALLVMFGVSWIANSFLKKPWILIGGILINIGTIFVWYRLDISVYKTYWNDYSLEPLYPFLLLRREFINTYDSNRIMWLGIIMGVMAILVLILLKASKEKILVTCFMAVAVYAYLYKGFYYDNTVQKSYTEKNSSLVESVNGIFDKLNIEKKFYVLDYQDTGNRLYFYLQFYYPDYEIIPINYNWNKLRTEFEKEDSFVIVNKNGDIDTFVYSNAGMENIAIDDQYDIYTNNPSIIEVVDENVPNSVFDGEVQ